MNVVFFPQLILFFVGSSVESDASGTMKTITYGDKSDSGDDVSLLCEELIPTLERLELLSEVCFFYWLQLSSLKLQVIPTWMKSVMSLIVDLPFQMQGRWLIRFKFSLLLLKKKKKKLFTLNKISNQENEFADNFI